jgi:tRNA-2-methylthio-N6-dimethylallyladenosine synthase
MKYFIRTFGCQMNKSDSERIARLLEKQGYKESSEMAEADLIVVNMCSVRQSAVDRVYGMAKKFAKLKTQNSKLKTLLTGCVSKKDFLKFRNFFDFILPIKTLSLWPRILKKEKFHFLPDQREKNFVEKFDCDYLKIKPKYKNPSLVFIPISTGCDNFCSFCIVPFVRGPLVCRDHKEILKEVKEAVKNGAKEIWLLGQNVNDYRSPSDKKVNFPQLLKMVEKIPGDFKFFFTSPHPKNFSDDLIEVLSQSKKFGKYLNLPVQSGDDTILKKMNRNYTVKEYKNLVKKIREKIPEIKLSTDVIVGFPGETKRQFESTLNLFKEIKFDYAYIGKFSPRPGTAASKMEDNVPWKEKKERERKLRSVFKKNYRGSLAARLF